MGVCIVVVACSDGTDGAPVRTPVALRVGVAGPLQYGSIWPGLSVEGFQAVPVDAAGDAVGTPVVARWSSSDTNVLAVAPLGVYARVTSRGTGKAVVRATWDSPGTSLRGQSDTILVPSAR